MEEKKLQKQIVSFIQLLSKINKYEYYGIAKILAVPTRYQIVGAMDSEVKSFETLTKDMIYKFATVHPRARKELLKMMKEVVKETEKKKEVKVKNGKTNWSFSQEGRTNREGSLRQVRDG